MSAQQIQKICLLRLSAIGDCCHALAVVRTLQKHLPDAQLTWIIGKVEAGLMANLDGVELLVYDKRASRKRRRAFATELRQREFDVLLNMHASWRANRVSRWVRTPRKIGFDRARARDCQWLFTNESIASQHRPHVIDGFFGFAERLGVTAREYAWGLPLADSDYELAERIIDGEQPLVVISPCSSDRRNNFRNWPAAHFVQVANHVADRYGATIVVTGAGSAAEHEYAEWIRNDGPAGTHDLVGKTSLKELAALIDRASVVLCPDSGPAHMASATGTPVVGLYATSNPGRTGPVLNPEYTVDAYPQALQKYLGKRVEEVRWGQRVRHEAAMLLVDVEAVIQKLDALLA
ncbi:MAG: glycosyltransferase family 9 protein [Pseudomonadota bacterium]